MYQLHIGSKNYSSWSLRPWILMKHFKIEFLEKNAPLDGELAYREYVENGLLPCLYDDGFNVWDSLAIAEYLAEKHPEMWPQNPKARARARCISAEMHSGFSNLRCVMPMNIKLRAQGGDLVLSVKRDIERICSIWREARQMAERGPYLFGAFSVADAMYAPVVWRLYCYNVTLPDDVAIYRDVMLNHPAMKEWEQGALAEKLVLPQEDMLLEAFGGRR
ncbi:glutathione S-transferase [Iodobacter sp. LRB]|nr:glutathione S-transferase [Iodobacter sp. BJB302]PHV00138.1 glutathione S-transferase [Iodobacter sp. BJB302]